MVTFNHIQFIGILVCLVIKNVLSILGYDGKAIIGF